MVLPPYAQFGTRLLLVNKHGQCLAVNTKEDIGPSLNGARIIQSDCNSSERGQIWKRNGDRICNDWNKCISTPLQQKSGTKTSIVIHRDLNHEDQHQQFRETNENHLINLGNCLGIKDDADYPGAEAKTGFCNEKENGQIWQFFNTEYARNMNKDYGSTITYLNSKLFENNRNSIIGQANPLNPNSQSRNQIATVQPTFTKPIYAGTLGQQNTLLLETNIGMLIKSTFNTSF